ncbi:MAG: putative ribonucleotide transport ATP-binding protein mkl [Planctomycetes bacterium]|nr:putative ribonucleotide transport ATP-binding protein mkl [Planctomycetota bacterium]
MSDGPPPPEPAVRVTGLRAAFDGRTILENVSFDVRRGEVFVILGGSGCGKSTLLKHMIGLLHPAEGRVEIEGRDLTAARGAGRQSILSRFGVLYQSGALFSSLTVAQNVALPLEEFTSLPKEAIRSLVRIKLELVGLLHAADRFPSEISGGMKKRAGVARALALDPSILFLDEPSAGLDPITSAELDHLILSLRRVLGATLVIVTHELQSIYAVADRCIMLDRARRTIVAEGRPADLRDGSSDPWVRAFFRREVPEEAKP